MIKALKNALTEERLLLENANLEANMCVYTTVHLQLANIKKKKNKQNKTK